MKISIPLLLVLACASTCAASSAVNQADPRAQEDHRRMDRDIELVDAYLAKWDRFARGENPLVAELNRDGPAAIAALVRAFKVKDKRAPARLVFLTVVQVGGGIPVESELGRSASALLGPKFPSVKTKKGQVYFAGDLYFWWMKSKSTKPIRCSTNGRSATLRGRPSFRCTRECGWPKSKSSLNEVACCQPAEVVG